MWVPAYPDRCSWSTTSHLSVLKSGHSDVRKRWASSPVKKFFRDESFERFLERLGFDVDQGFEHIVGKLAAQDRSNLSHFPKFRSAVEPSHQRVLQGTRNLQLAERTGHHRAAAVFAQQPRVEHRLREFLDVKWNSIGLGKYVLEHFLR